MSARTTHLVVGESVVDVIERPDGSVERHPGGSPANVALGLGRLGADVTLRTQLGRDHDGDLLRRHLASAGVRLEVTDGPTSTARAALDEHGAAEYELDVAWALDRVGASPWRPTHVHTGSLATVVQPGAEAVHALVASLRGGSTVSYDPNVRPGLMGPREVAVPAVERLVALSDVVKASEDDVAWLYPDRDPVDVAYRWLTVGPALVVVTLGARGAVAVTPHGVVESPPHPVDVADTVGAGDSFMAALLARLGTGGLLGASGRRSLRVAPPARLAPVLSWAARAAAVTVSRRGADLPDTAALTGATA
ncbi:ribokinase [Cellulomonas chitinilytica]|uniref:Ribokinase n=1 Tax=Cellulomonas chitinilytica TaxID=398759 RepID=A0A919U164_9CELL|nr:carbohydrate kinase [Cellulomonas chitinilytica]GIG23675.1 ribokinase [Cellulomonas chitinilytica]